MGVSGRRVKPPLSSEAASHASGRSVMPALPSTATMTAAGGSAPKPAATAAARPPGLGRSVRERGVLVAAQEVVGRPLAVWSQKLLDWPKAVVASYRAETQEHLIRFEDPAPPQHPAEQWVKLGSTRFQWLREQAEGAAPNPTHAGTPRGDDCVGRRLKVFWPGMGRWYQGKVQSYDPASRKHCIKYRDGDIQELRLRHEAIIWVDVGPMQHHTSTPSALQSPTSASRPRPAAPTPPAAGAGRSPAAKRQPSPAAVTAKGGAATRASPAAKRARREESSSGDEHLRSNKSSVTREGGVTAAGRGGEAAGPVAAALPSEQVAAGGGGPGGGSSNIGSAMSGQSQDEEGLGGSSSSDVESQEEQDDDDGDSSVVTDDLGSEASSDLGHDVDSDFEVESLRNTGPPSRRGAHRRSGAAAAAGTVSGRSGGGRQKRSGGSRRAKKSSAGRPRKGAGAAHCGAQDRGFKPRRDYGRGAAAPVAAAVRPKLAVRADDETARMAGGCVVGARVAVLWAHDQQYYKGNLLQFDSYHKRSKIMYDDGEEEWISLTRETFKWLTPRGRSAGCVGEMREAMAQLGPHQDAAAALPAAAMTAQAGATGVGTRGQSEGAQGPFPMSSPTPMGEVADVGAKGSPKAESAVGWQVSVLCDSDAQWYRGEVLAYDRRKTRHLVLYDDGEEEWLALERESVAWHKLARGANAICPGLKPGLPAPRGRAAVGWRVGVFWPLDLVFYNGELTAYDSTTGRHTVVYDDGEVRSLSLSTDKIKWILPPGSPVVGTGKLEGSEVAGAVRGRRKGMGVGGESDPDYEFENRTRPTMRRLPRLLTTASLPGAAADLSCVHPSPAALPGEASVAGLLQHTHTHPASPYWPASNAGGLLPNRSLSSLAQVVPLSPSAEQCLGEAVLVRQLTRVPTLGSFNTGAESEATHLPNPITVRIYMSSSSTSSGGGEGGGNAADTAVWGRREDGTAAQDGPPGHAPGTPSGGMPAGERAPAGRQQVAGRQAPSMRSRLSALDLMSRRVLRAQHTLVKGVPTALPPRMPRVLSPVGANAQPGAAALSPTHLLHHPMQHQQQRCQQQQQYGAAGSLHRLARASNADHPLSPVYRRPHPALSDEEASSSSGSSDDESEREQSPSALLSPRSAAAALNGAKIKPDQVQQGQQVQQGVGLVDLEGDALMLDAGDMATPSDSGTLGLVPPLVRASPQLESPFSAGGLLRSAPPAALHVYPGKPLFPGSSMGERGAGALAGCAAEPGTEEARAGGSSATLGMARSMSLTGGLMLDSLALPPASDPINGLLAMGGPGRNDSEFNLLAMGGAELASAGMVCEEEVCAPCGGLMDLEVGEPGDRAALAALTAAVGAGGLGAAALVDTGGLGA